jgi:hypothetical protein
VALPMTQQQPTPRLTALNKEAVGSLACQQRSFAFSKGRIDRRTKGFQHSINAQLQYETVPSNIYCLFFTVSTVLSGSSGSTISTEREVFVRKLLFLVVLGIIGAGQLKADPACMTNTLAFYESNITSAASGCSIGTLNFWNFNTGDFGTFPSGPGSAPFDASQILLTPVSSGGSFGFLITPVNTNGFQATATGARDVEIPFQVACADGSSCLSGVTMSLAATATGFNSGGQSAATAALTETYCLGGVTPPPTAPCPGAPGSAVTQDSLKISLGDPGSVSRTDTFTAVSQLSMNKDISAIGNDGTANVMSVEDLFNTPEPGTLLMLAMGLSGLGFLYRRRQLS